MNLSWEIPDDEYYLKPPHQPDLADQRKRRAWEHQEQFLKLYAQTGRIGDSLQAIGLSPDCKDVWLKRDTLGFKERWHYAQQGRREYLEKLAMDRLENPQGNRGSDLLLMFRTKAEWPEKYREVVVSESAETGKELLRELRQAYKEAMTQKPGAGNQSQVDSDPNSTAAAEAEAWLKQRRQGGNP